MALTDIRILLKEAAEDRRAVGAFNVCSIEMIYGCVTAAEELDTPIILQVAESRLQTTPLFILGPAMIAAAKSASVPIAVQFDHGKSMDRIREALDLGFTSIMFDGSSLPMEENIEKTRFFADLAHRYGAACEGEIGSLGVGEAGETQKAAFTDPDEAVIFAERTGVDALAVAIGNAHGVYAGTPVFHFEVLQKIREKSGIPLVLHGGSGSGEEQFRRCIRDGVQKINIATANFMADARARARTGGEDFFAMSRAALEAVRLTTREHIRIFGIRKEF